MIERNLVLSFLKGEKIFSEKNSIFVSPIFQEKESLFLLLLISIMDTLVNTIYLKEMKVIFAKKEDC